MTSPEKINALLVEQVIRTATSPENGSLGIQGLNILCAVIRLGRPPVRAVAKSLGRHDASVGSQMLKLAKDGYLREEKDEIYAVKHYSATPKALALFSPRVMAPAPDAQ